jgi:hypothetical protein
MEKVNAIRRPVYRAAPVAAVLALAACASPPPPFPDLPRLSVATRITSRNMCGLAVSPAITIGNAPAAAARYRFRMTNTDVLFRQPWQTTVPATSNGFREGALADYEGPCIGELRLYAPVPYFTYRFEVLALDAQDRPLAYGQTTLLVQSIGETVEQEKAAVEREKAAGGQSVPAPPPTPPASSVNPIINPALFPRQPGTIYEP